VLLLRWIPEYSGLRHIDSIRVMGWTSRRTILLCGFDSANHKVLSDSNHRMNPTTAVFTTLSFVSLASANAQEGSEPTKQSMQEPSVRFLNRAPAGYSNIVEVRGGRTLYISGQLSVDAEGKLVGPGDLKAQAKQVFANIDARLKEAGASLKNVVKLNYYVTDTNDIQSIRDARDAYVDREHPPASSLVVVKRLVREEYLIEVDAVAVVPD
jgi:enamine deaminase RidA (YjgF/YER057c/UK114 family)